MYRKIGVQLNCKISVCLLAEDEVDELTLHVVRYRPEELDKLTKNTKFTRKEIQLIYRGFKQVQTNITPILTGILAI